MLLRKSTANGTSWIKPRPRCHTRGDLRLIPLVGDRKMALVAGLPVEFRIALKLSARRGTTNAWSYLSKIVAKPSRLLGLARSARAGAQANQPPRASSRSPPASR